jgi:hypothetical protein
MHLPAPFIVRALSAMLLLAVAVPEIAVAEQISLALAVWFQFGCNPPCYTCLKHLLEYGSVRRGVLPFGEGQLCCCCQLTVFSHPCLYLAGREANDQWSWVLSKSIYTSRKLKILCMFQVLHVRVFQNMQ